MSEPFRFDGEEVSWGDIVDGAAAVAARVAKKVEGKVEYAAKVVVDGQRDQAPVSLAVDWWYPTDGSTITIEITHVRVVDDIQIHFDFGTHEWVAEQELQAKSDHEPATGIWVEVARWSGNAPTAISSVDGGTVETKPKEGG